jgi:integrase
MARPATGTVVERESKDGTTFAIRFRAHGARQFVTLGTDKEGWTRARAEQKLSDTMALVREGLWAPPVKADTPREEPTFHLFASEWLDRRRSEGLAAKTIEDLRWSIEVHLLPHFAALRLSEITVQEVDGYKAAKVRQRELLEASASERSAAVTALEKERRKARNRSDKEQARKLTRQLEALRVKGLSNNSINHTLSDLAQVLETAVEYGLLSSNPASGKRRRLKSARPSRPWAEPEQLPALLRAAPKGAGRMLLGLLAGAGLRIDEALSLRWRNVDLGAGTLTVIDAKTDAGVRAVDLTAALWGELRGWWHQSRHAGPDDYVLPTPTGRKANPSNLRRDVLRPAIENANAELAKDGIAPLATTFHGLRRTYASLRCACGDDLAYTSSQIGHEDGRFTLKVYAQATRRRERLSGAHLRAYDEAIAWARMGTVEAANGHSMGTGDERERVLAT